MPMRSVPLPTLLVAMLLGLATTAALQPGVARADAYSKVERAYSQTGTIPACRFRSSELVAALRETPTYDLEYFGDFTSAVHIALSQQAGGRCQSTGSVVGSLPLGQGPRGNLAVPSTPTSSTSAAMPLPLLLTLVLLLGGTGLLAVGWLVGLGGWDPSWAQAARHAWVEAEYRVVGRWAEFTDRLRS